MRNKTTKSKSEKQEKNSSKAGPIKSKTESAASKISQSNSTTKKAFLDELKSQAKLKRREQYKIAKAKLQADPRYQEMIAKKKDLEKKHRKDVAERRKKNIAEKKATESATKKSSLAGERFSPISKSTLGSKKSSIKNFSADVESIEFHLELRPIHQDRLHSELETARDKKSPLKQSKENPSSFNLGKHKQTKDKFKTTQSLNSEKKKPLFRTGSSPELKELAEIIDVDFINKKRQKSRSRLS